MSEFGQRIAQPGEDFRVADRLEIMDLAWRFAVAMDIGDLDMFEACFADPLTWDLSDNPVYWTGGPADHGPVELSRAEFMAIVRGRDAAKLERPPAPRATVRHFTQHGVLNPIVTFTGEQTATLLAYNHERMHRWFAVGDQEEAEGLDQGGFYHLDARRVGDRWRLSALRLKIRFYDPDGLYRWHARRPERP
jgi:hypothetical protein